MNLRRLLAVSVLALVVVVTAVVGGLFLYSQHLYRDSYGSDYTYEVRVSPSAPITNATFLVALPTHDGSSPVTEAAVRHPFTPDGWSYDIVEADDGQMLRIRADAVPTDPTYHYSVVRDDRLVGWETIPEAEYDPDNSSHLRVTHEDVDVQTGVEVNQTIDTAAPIGSEPLLRPHENRTDSACYAAPDEEEACHVYDGRAFVSYDAAPDTAVYVSVELRGSNSWWVFGWSFNEYVDTQTVETVGPQDGWVTTDGELRTGNGNYRPPPE
jgi:hypothetical protein